MRVFFRFIKNLLFSLIVLWGIVAVLVRMAAPLLSAQKDQLAALLSEQLDIPIEIGGLQGSWYGWGPILRLQELRIGTAGQTLEMASAKLDLDPRIALRGHINKALRLTLDGLVLHLVRNQQGQLHIQGLPGFKGTGQREDNQASLPLPHHVRMLNTRIIWEDHKAGIAPLEVTDLNLEFQRQQDEIQVRANMRGPSGTAELAARLDGFLVGTDWRGDTYLKIKDLDVARLFAPYLPTDYSLDAMQLDLEIWNQWHEARPVDSRGQVQVRQLLVRATDTNAGALQVKKLQTGFNFQRDSNDWRLLLDGLELSTPHGEWPRSRAAVQLRHERGLELDVAADFVRLQDVLDGLQIRLPWVDMVEPLKRMQPRGDLRDIRLQVDLSDDDFRWRAKADFDDMALNAWQDIPGVTSISGKLHGQLDHLVLQLDSDDVAVDTNGLFRRPLRVDRLHGRLDWQQQGTGWQLVSDKLLAENAHIKTLTRLLVDKQPGQPLEFDLQTDFGQGDAGYASLYYPTAIMDENLVKWLDNSILAGRVPQGSLLLQGTTTDFPYHRTRNGVFEINFDVKNAQLDYQPGWPELNDIDANLRFHGNSLDMRVHNGRIYNGKVSNTLGHIASLEPPSPLTMRGTIDGSVSDNLRLLKEGALREDFGHIAEVLKGKGNTRLKLDFDVPLAETDKYRLDGRLHFSRAELSLPDWNLNISDIRGDLDISLDALSARGISGRALGSQIKLDANPLPDGTTRIDITSELDVRDIARQLPQVPVQYLSGKSRFDISLDVPGVSAKADIPTRLTIRSDLKGIDVDLPAPVGKRSRRQRQLHVSLPVSGEPAPSQIDYDKVLSAEFSADWRRGTVVFGGRKKAKLSDAAGYKVTGHLNTLDVDHWNTVLQQLPDTGGTLEDPLSYPPIDARLKINNLRLDAMRISNLELILKTNPDIWRGQFSAESFRGDFAYFSGDSNAPIQVNLDHLYLQHNRSSSVRAIPPLPDFAAGPDPRHFPPLQLSCRQLRINDADLGRLDLLTTRSPEGLNINKVTLQDGDVTLESSGRWVSIDNGYRTELKGEVRTAELGKLFTQLGYSQQFENAPTQLSFIGHWPGNPAQFHKGSLQAEVDLLIGKGQLIQVNPGVGRVTGLLNFSALSRRLRLDFSDLYKKGFTFDTIQGSFHIEDGHAYNNDLSIRGPAGLIQIGGRVGLLERDLDQEISITPRLDATLPIAGTLAGGPVAGVAVLVAQKLWKDRFNELSRFEYSVRGSWDDPQVQRLANSDKASKRIQSAKVESQQPPPRAAPLTVEPEPREDLRNRPDTEPDTEPDSEEKTNLFEAFLKKIIKNDNTSNDELLDNVGH